MILRTIFITICLISSELVGAKNVNGNNKVLSRKKRYLVFPEGSSLSIAICMTAQMGITPGELFTEGMNWGISYELPNDTKPFKDFYQPKHVMMRRNRRDLYGKMETIISSMGYDGRSCILRTLCEASTRFTPQGDSLVERILKIVFGFPGEKVTNSEPDEHRIYHWAYQTGLSNSQDQECAAMFPHCPFSLIDLALGYYSHFIDPDRK